ASRRADREPRPRHRPAGAGLARPAHATGGPDHGHGHPQSRCHRARRSDLPPPGRATRRGTEERRRVMLLRARIRHLLRHRWQAGLAVLGIALGVAVVVSVDLAGESARRAFALAAEGVTGRATHEIVGGPAGLDERVVARLAREVGVRPLAPVIVAWVGTGNP